MENNINVYLEQLEKKKKEVSELSLEISAKKEEYNSVLNRLMKKLSNKKQEIVSLYDNIVFSVRLGDLIYEISRLSGVDVRDIKVKLETNVMFDDEYDVSNMLEMLSKDKHKHFIRMTLSSVNQNINSINFDYFTFLPLDFEMLQSDGSMLVEHCSLVRKKTDDQISIEIDIDKNIEDIILVFDLSYLEKQSSMSWYPADLFSQAISNCSNCIQNNSVKALRRFK